MPSWPHEDQTASLRFVGFNGFAVPHIEKHELVDAADVREHAASYLQKRREEGCDVTVLETGHEWEIITESNREGRAVTDSDGLLVARYYAWPSDDIEWDD